MERYLSDKISDDASEEEVLRDQVDEDEENHVEDGEGELVAVQEHGVERVAGVSVEDSLVCEGGVLKLDVHDLLQEQLVSDLEVQIPKRLRASKNIEKSQAQNINYTVCNYIRALKIA